MVQANSGIYRVEDSYLDACKRFQRQESSDSKGAWTTYEMELDLWPGVKNNDWVFQYIFFRNGNIILFTTDVAKSCFSFVNVLCDWCNWMI